MGRRENNIKERSSKAPGRNRDVGRKTAGQARNSAGKRGPGSYSGQARGGGPGTGRSDSSDSRSKPQSRGASGKTYRSNTDFDHKKSYSRDYSGRSFSDTDTVTPCFETIVGFHAIEEMLKEKNIEGTLYISGKGKRHEKISAMSAGMNIKIQKVSDEVIQKKSPGIDPRGVVLEVTGKREKSRETSVKVFLDKLEKSGKENSLVLILDGITDPHNLGAILRSADQFDVDLVILPSSRSAGDNSTVRKISSGASEYVPQAVENLSRAADLLKKSGFWIYAADMGGDDSWKLNLKGRTALVLGSEGEGVSRILTEKSDSIIKIPASGHVDSFNVSVAAGILMYETVRQFSV